MVSLTASATPAQVGYVVRALDLHAHVFEVTLAIAQPATDQLVSLPVWIPGSYLLREFAKHLQGLHARQGNKPVAMTQRDKCSWQIHTKAGKALCSATRSTPLTARCAPPGSTAGADFSTAPACACACMDRKTRRTS
jgi:hypothetical protein